MCVGTSMRTRLSMYLLRLGTSSPTCLSEKEGEIENTFTSQLTPKTYNCVLCECFSLQNVRAALFHIMKAYSK